LHPPQKNLFLNAKVFFPFFQVQNKIRKKKIK
jgi:hypothetical protein